MHKGRITSKMIVDSKQARSVVVRMPSWRMYAASVSNSNWSIAMDDIFILDGDSPEGCGKLLHISTRVVHHDEARSCSMTNANRLEVLSAVLDLLYRFDSLSHN